MTTPLTSFQGIASGIQWRDLVDQIVQIETTRSLGPVSQGLNAANARIAGWDVLSAAVTKLRDSLRTLQDGTAFRTRTASVGATASGRTLASISNIASSAPGRYRVEVQNLAQTEKLSGAAVADPTVALGVSGRFSVNGVSISLETSDSLNIVRDKLNAANTGSAPSRVSASIVSSGGASRLVLNADSTGAGGIELADDRSGDGGTSTLESLGLVDSSRALNRGEDGKVRSMRVSSSTLAAAAALGVGMPPAPAVILVNGRAITVDLENDSITDIVARINALSPGAAKVETESDGGTTWSRMAISGSVASDGSGGSDLVLETLGLSVGGRASNVTQVVTAGATFTGLAGATATSTTLLTDLGTGVAAGVQVGDVITLSGTDGAGAAVSLIHTVGATDTVADLLGAMEGAFAGGRAVSTAIVDGRLTFTDSSAGDSRLSIALSAGLQGGGTLDFGDPTTVFGRVRQLSAGENARVMVDGALFTARTNTLTGAAGGATLTLTGEEPGAEFDVTVNATRDSSVAVVQAFAATYNELLTAVTNETRSGGRLAFSSTARSILGALKGSLLNDMTGLGDAARFVRAGNVGLELQRDGTLKLNADTFRAALGTDPFGVEALFASGGASSNGNVQFVGADPITPSGSFALSVTQAATRSSVIGGVMSPLTIGAGPVTMTLTSEASGNSATITLSTGDTAALIAARIQAALVAGGVGVSASVEGGALRLSADDHGSGAGFTVSYDDPNGDDPAAQLGIAIGDHDNGLDAAGTLDGEALTGAGQILTAANGLVMRYIGTSDSASATVRNTRGLAGSLAATAATILDTESGTISLQLDSARNRIVGLERREIDLLGRIERRRIMLVADFNRMESLLGRLQGQGQWLTAQINSLKALRPSQ